MANAPALLSIDEYLRTSYHPDADYVDGKIACRNVGKYEHGKVQGLIALSLSVGEEVWAIDLLLAQRIRIGLARIRVCDVAVLHKDAPFERITVTPPLICIEVLSTDDTLPGAVHVLSDYFLMGVPNIWLVDPIRRVAYIYNASGLQPAASLALTVPVRQSAST